MVDLLTYRQRSRDLEYHKKKADLALNSSSVCIFWLYFVSSGASWEDTQDLRAPMG